MAARFEQVRARSDISMSKTSIASSAARLRIAAANATKVAIRRGSVRSATARARTEEA
ncbi:hypothetical protein [Streptomyces syringium]|uniref:hypothetical protein n=1 Tax=Streptomyces syringium TaxID=76729 RepID=UPI003456485E